MSELKRKTVSGVAWSSVALFINQILQFVISIILARLLTPKDFGLVAMIIVFTGFVQLFNEFGLGAALIQNQNISDKHKSSVFWLNLVIGALITTLTIVYAPLIARFYGVPSLIPLTMLVAINFIIQPFGIVQEALLTRAMQFQTLAIVNIISVLMAGFLAIFLAFSGYGVWSLIWQTVAGSCIKVLVLWHFIEWRPRFVFNRLAIVELLGFSGNLVGFRILNYWMRNSDNLLVGKFFGTGELGIYSRAYSIMLLALNNITRVLGRVMFPALSEVQDNKLRVKGIYLRTIQMIAIVSFPLMLGLWVIAEPFVLTLYGQKWIALIPLVRIFSLLGLVQSIGATVGWIYQSQGRTDLLFRWGVFAGIMSVSSILIGIWLGTLEAVAACYAFTSGVLLIYPLFEIPGRLINMRFFEVISNVSGIFVCALLMSIFVWGVGHLLPVDWPSWRYLIIQITCGVVVYISLLQIFKVQAYHETRMLIAENLLFRIGYGQSSTRK